MNELIEKFDKCLDTWIDLPEYVYSDEYKKAFIDFAEKRLIVGQIIDPSFAVMTLHHETDGRLPYFDFNRER